MTGMIQTGCCAVDPNPCKGCNYDVPICCILVTHDLWAHQPVLIGSGVSFEVGDTCDTSEMGNCTNLCGTAFSLAYNDVGYRDPDLPPKWPSWDSTTHGCLPSLRLTWGVADLDHCDDVIFTLYLGRSGSPRVTVDRDWYLTPFQIPDAGYAALNAIDPLTYPPPIPNFTFEVCPTEFPTFPDPDERVYLRGEYQRLEGGGWDGNTGYYQEVYGVGNCVCSQYIGCRPDDPQYPDYLYWRYIPLTDEIEIYTQSQISASSTESILVPYNSCNWPDDTYYLYLDPEFRVKIERVRSCNERDPNTPPPPEPKKYCYATRLCVLLSVDGGASYQYYRLDWNGTDVQYYMAAAAVPGGKPYTIEITLKEDPKQLPEGSPAGSSAWVLTVVIRETTGGTVAAEYTEVYVLECSAKWSRTSELAVESPPAADWFLKIATNCPDPPDPPDPPPCDPGCWPECLKCPTPKTLYASFDSSPSCCVAGTYELTWVPTGGSSFPLAGYYELPSSIGGPIDTCGVVDFLRVFCIDSSSIMVQLHYLRAEGTEIDHTAPPLTLSVSCTGGHLESAPFNIPGRSGYRDSLCGVGSGVGTNLRIISS